MKALVNLAMARGLEGFEICHYIEDGEGTDVLVESDERRAKQFYDIIKEKCPKLAEIDDIKSEDYNGEIRRRFEYAITFYSMLNCKLMQALIKASKN